MKGLKRRATKVIKVGNLLIGNGNPIIVESMTTTPTKDTAKTLRQIRKLYNAGCELVRVAIPDRDTLPEFEYIVNHSPLPIIADIHFNPELAIQAIRRGASKIRINPGNIHSEVAIRKIIDEAKARGIPVRIGVNAGSLEKKILEKYKHPTPEAMLESLRNWVSFFESHGFENLILSAKSSDPFDTIEVNRLIAKEFNYPIHLGVTEAGLPFEGGIRSATAISILLNEGIGDTIRISLTANPVKEVEAAYELLGSLKLRTRGPIIISCPICGRAKVDVEKLTKKIKKSVRLIKKPIKIAVMGCEVNGPGEAREADVGIAGGKRKWMIFKKGEIVKVAKEEEIIQEFLKILKEL